MTHGVNSFESVVILNLAFLITLFIIIIKLFMFNQLNFYKIKV